MVTSVLPRVLQDGRTVPSDECHRLMLDALNLRPDEKVLEVGTGSGTTARWLATACCDCDCVSCSGSKQDLPTVWHCGSPACHHGLELHTVELRPLYGEVIRHDDVDVYFHAGDGQLGLPGEAPFDVIVASCGVGAVPDAWLTQLREDGRLLAPVGQPAGQRLVLLTKTHGQWHLERVVAYVRFSMMREDIA